MKFLSIDELLEFYNNAESVDQEVFADQRSNLLLVASDHYNKKGSRYWNNIRESKEIQPEQKLRLTKNHIQKITKTYVNAIVSYAPSVVAVPNNEKENQDIKAAVMNNSVIQYAKAKNRMKDKILQFAEDFVNIGEVACKLFWDPSAGELIGYEPVLDEMGEQLIIDGEPQQTPIFTGDILTERIFGFNLLRHPAAQEMIGGHHPLCIRKMVDIKELKKKVGNDEKKLAMITETQDKTFQVFDANTNGYGKSKDQTMLMEFYYPKCEAYPEGYYYFATMGGILWHGPLPFGIWPIIYTGFDAVQTSPRHRSIIKPLRPYQAEVNRTASKIAENQITSDTKLLIPSGSKVASGVQLPGIRAITYSGGKPEYLQGQTGEQYLNYMTSQINEMYQVANLEGINLEKEMLGDIQQNLYRSLRQKKKFTIYTDKFETFLVNYWETYLELAKAYFPDEMVIPMVGRSEIVNLAEFRNTEKLCYSIKIEPQTDDLETQMGRQAIFNHILQYVGPSLDKKAMGQLIKQMPFGNWKEGFSELTLDEDMAENMVLALDRGQVPIPNKYDDAPYMIRRLVDRVRRADFEALHPQIQKNYDTMIRFYEKMEADRQLKIMEAQKGFIPSGGARIKADYYVPKAGNPSQTERVSLPAEAVDWLMKRLAEQGSSQEILQQVNEGAVAEIAGVLNQQQGAGLTETEQAPTLINGQASPGGLQ